MRYILIVLRLTGFFAAIIFAGSSSRLFAEAGVSTAPYVYKARGLRDPFVPLLNAAGSASGMSASQSSLQIEMSPEDLEKAFNPEDLVLKALLTDKSPSASIGVLANESNPDDEYIVKGSKIKHRATGLFLKSYSAQIQKDAVVVKRVNGDSMMAVISFRKEEDSKP